VTTGQSPRGKVSSYGKTLLVSMEKNNGTHVIVSPVKSICSLWGYLVSEQIQHFSFKRSGFAGFPYSLLTKSAHISRSESSPPLQRISWDSVLGDCTGANTSFLPKKRTCFWSLSLACHHSLLQLPLVT